MLGFWKLKAFNYLSFPGPSLSAGWSHIHHETGAGKRYHSLRNWNIWWNNSLDQTTGLGEGVSSYQLRFQAPFDLGPLPAKERLGLDQKEIPRNRNDRHWSWTSPSWSTFFALPYFRLSSVLLCFESVLLFCFQITLFSDKVNGWKRFCDK